MFIIKPYKTPEILKPKTDNERNKKLFDRKDFPRNKAILIFAFWLSTYCVSESTILGFGATYFQYCPLKLTAKEAADLVSAIAIAFTVGRGVSVLMAIKFKPKHMISYHLVLLFLSVIALFFGHNNITVLWLACIMTGLGLSAMYPAMFAFLEQYIIITNPIGATAILFSDCINLFNPYILGLFVEKYSIIVIIFELFYVSICFSLFILILYFIRKYKSKLNES